MARGGVPDDFAGFVDTHHGHLARTCQALAGPSQTALARELLALVALHWWWLRRWPARRASAYLDRLLLREARACGADLDVSGQPEWTRPGSTRRRGQQPTLPVVLDPGPPNAQLAEQAWQHAGQLRRQRRRLVAILALGLCAAVVIAPRAEPKADPAPTPRPGPTAVPPGVTLVPKIDELITLAAIPSAIPEQIRAGPQASPVPSQAPGRVGTGGPAVAALQTGAGDLLIVRSDGAQRIDDARLSGARLLATSLSPHGERVALLGTGTVFVLAVGTGRLSEVGAGLIRADLASFVWLSDRSLLLPGTQGGSWQVDVDTGRTTELASITGVDVVTSQGSVTPALTELLPNVATVDARARIRIWRSGPAADTDDRLITGPAWLGRFIGPGWSSGNVFARECAPGNLTLPARFGPARAVLASIAANGLYLGALVGVDATVEVVGFVSPQVLLVHVSAAGQPSVLIAWRPGQDEVRRVSTIDRGVTVSVADLLLRA